MVYALVNSRAGLLAVKFGVDRGKIKWKEKNEEVKDRHIQHTLMISDFRIWLKLALDILLNTHLFWGKENPKELEDYVCL